MGIVTLDLYAMKNSRKVFDSMPYPHATVIRSALLDRVDEYTRLTGQPISAVGRAAVNDPHFIFDVRIGHNFTVSRYQRVHDWLDRNWPERERRARNGKC
jgi:hypothetical protein